MREISPAKNLSADEVLKITNHPKAYDIVAHIRQQKLDGSRPVPSKTLMDRSRILNERERCRLLDKVAAFVDENLFGRSEMCIQFADLLSRALSHLGFPAKAVLGDAIYFIDMREVFRWKHAWVRIGDEVVDGNVDCLNENPEVPKVVRVAPYWGPVRETPSDRRLRELHGHEIKPDQDVLKIWWPEMLTWLDNEAFAHFPREVRP